jgi:hypothetical protein
MTTVKPFHMVFSCPAGTTLFIAVHKDCCTALNPNNRGQRKVA